MQARFAAVQNGSPVDGASLALSFAVYHSMLGHLPEFDRGIKRARFAVLRLTSIPGILVEGGFLSERQESRMIASSEWRGKLAKAIAVGIENYRTLAEKKQRPTLLADYRRQLEGVLVARDASAPRSPDAAAAPGVRPASNITPLAGAAAQMTVAVRHEPSAQMSVNGDGDADADEPEGEGSQPPQPQPSVVAATQPAANGQPVPPVPSAGHAADVPPSPDQPPAPAAASTDATPSSVASSAEDLVSPPSSLHSQDAPARADAPPTSAAPSPSDATAAISPTPGAGPSPTPAQSWKDWFLSFFRRSK
jgi:hypothetical protein